jgi:DNA recombination protein RmuC
METAFADGAMSPAFLVAVAVVVVVLVAVAAMLWRFSGSSRRAQEEATARAAELESRIGSLIQAQSEIGGRIQSMTDLIGGRQAELNQSLSERLDGMTHRLNQSMGEATKTTHEGLKTLHERLAVLDSAQHNISTLAGQVTTLSNILANKQSRGAFGQGRMEAIISDGLPVGSFGLQVKLSSGVVPDCLIHLPNKAPPLVVDAKFPLEAYNALKAASTPEALKAAQQQFRNDVSKHIKDISEKYLIPGETHDTAFMFVASESVFAEIHESFSELIQRAHHARIVVVSPMHLLLSIQVIQAVLRDHRFREQAHIIQDEVRKMMLDVERLNDRVGNLGRHFQAVEKDVEQVLISSGKVVERGRGIETIGIQNGNQTEPAQLPNGNGSQTQRLL